MEFLNDVLADLWVYLGACANNFATVIKRSIVAIMVAEDCRDGGHFFCCQGRNDAPCRTHQKKRLFQRCFVAYQYCV